MKLETGSKKESKSLFYEEIIKNNKTLTRLIREKEITQYIGTEKGNSLWILYFLKE